MQHFYIDSTKEQRKQLRKNMTEEEVILWAYIRKRFPQHKFRRQVGIGPYIADFYCPKVKLVIELDGSQHLDSERDVTREKYMNTLGLTTIRFWNGDVRKNLNGVLMKIEQQLSLPPRKASAPSLS